MPTLATVNSAGKVEFISATDEEMRTSEVTRTPDQLEKVKADFENVLQELRAIDGGCTDSDQRSIGLLKKHGVWLHNLAKTGFAIDYGQFVKPD